MSKYNKKMIYDYIFGNDIEGYLIEQLENDYEFMKKVITCSNDKNMYNLCSDELKHNYEFIKFIIDKFKSDTYFICDVVDSYLEFTKDEIEIIELNIIMSELTKDCDNSVSLKYNLYSLGFYNTLAIDLEIYKRTENWIGRGFIIALDLYNSSKIVMDFLAKKFVMELFFDGTINLEEQLHKRFSSYEQLSAKGKNHFLIEIINCYDLTLGNYLSTNIEILNCLNEKMMVIKNNWQKYDYDKEINKYSLIIEKVCEYMLDYEYECSYTETEILYLIAKELNIADKIKKYDDLNYVEYVEDYNYSDYDDYDIDSDYLLYENSDMYEINTELKKENFSFNDYKHYCNIKKIVKEILKDIYDEYSIIDEPKNKVMGKIIEFNKKTNHKNNY